MRSCAPPPPAKEDLDPPPDLPEGVPPLRSFYLYLSDSCNLACRHCWITPRLVNGRPDPGEIINVQALRAAIAEAKPLGLRHVKLTGGEPLLHPTFREICALATTAELDLILETNGTLLSADLARYLKQDTSMSFISVSIDSADPARHDGFRGIPGAFAAAVQGLDHLVAAGFDNVQVVMSVHRGNRNDVAAVAGLAAAHGATSLKLNPVTSCGRGADMDSRGETLDFAERMELDRHVRGELAPLLRAAAPPFELILHTPPALMAIGEFMRSDGGVRDCGILGVLGVLGSGEIALCGIGRNVPELVFGRLGRDSVRTIWCQHPTLSKLRTLLADTAGYPEVCGTCTLARHCRTGCVAQNFVDGRQLVWPDLLCRQAEQRGLFPPTRRKRAFPCQ